MICALFADVSLQYEVVTAHGALWRYESIEARYTLVATSLNICGICGFKH